MLQGRGSRGESRCAIHFRSSDSDCPQFMSPLDNVVFIYLPCQGWVTSTSPHVCAWRTALSLSSLRTSKWHLLTTRREAWCVECMSTDVHEERIERTACRLFVSLSPGKSVNKAGGLWFVQSPSWIEMNLHGNQIGTGVVLEKTTLSGILLKGVHVSWASLTGAFVQTGRCIQFRCIQVFHAIPPSHQRTEDEISNLTHSYKQRHTLSPSHSSFPSLSLPLILLHPHLQAPLPQYFIVLAEFVLIGSQIPLSTALCVCECWKMDERLSGESSEHQDFSLRMFWCSEKSVLSWNQCVWRQSRHEVGARAADEPDE